MRTLRSFILSILAIAGAYALSGCGDYYETTPITAADAAYTFGLESNKPYPLVIGDKVSGTGGTVKTSVGYFRARTSVNLTPGSAVTVIFKKDNKEWHLEIPVSKATFEISESGPETVTLRISNQQSYYGRKSYKSQCFSGDYNEWKPLAPECDVRVNPSTTDAGLAPIVQSELTSALFVVTQATADQLSGRRN